ncbi:MAG: MBL fold metallo-hydrolase [Spirochaetes bacterium]|nr:MBL fold metallo-hydrolase [Spirochaetota bacterium]
MRLGYIFTDFPSEMKNGSIYVLKCLSFILIDQKYGAMIFDTGSPSDNANLVFQLKKHFDLTPEDIKFVFNTHIHPDHIGGNRLFTNARIVFSRNDFNFSEEMANVAFSGENMLEFLHRRCPGYKNSFDEHEAQSTVNYIKKYWSREAVGFNQTISFIEDLPDIPEFISIIPAFGHTFYHYAFEVSYRDKKFYISGDAVSNRFILKEENKDRMFEPHMDFEQYFKSVDFFRKVDNLIIPGHDRPFYPQTSVSIRKNQFHLDDL